MARFTSSEARKLRMVETKESLPTEAAYYTHTCTEWGRNGVCYWRLLDKEFNEIEKVFIRYTNILSDLIHVSDEKDDHDYKTAQMVYHLVDRNEKGFWKAESIHYGN